MRYLVVLSLILIDLATGAEAYDGQCRDLVVQGDYARALAVCTELADAGNPSAQNALGMAYALGLGVTQNYDEAAKWYRKAAEQGNAMAQNDLSLMYHKGRGVTRNAVISLMWNIMATQLGDQGALSNRKVIQGEMAPDNVAKARRLANECAEKSYKDCGF